MDKTLSKAQLQATLRHYQAAPNKFFRDVLGVEPWEKQAVINDTIARSKKTSVRSAHATGKSWDLARIALWFICCFPESIVLTTAPTWRQVEQILWRNIRSAYAKAKVPLGGTMLQTRWDIADDWYALGLSTDEPENFAGFHAPHILVIADEASGISEQIFEAIDGLLAGGNAKLVLIGNPTRTTGSFAKSWKDPSYSRLHISAFDTPNVKAGKTIVPGLVSHDFPADMERKYGKDSDVYRVRVLGDPPRTEADVLIPLEQVEAAMERTIEVDPAERVWMGVDVARFGGDRTIIGQRQGLRIHPDVRKFSGLDTMGIVGEVIRYFTEYKIPPEQVHIDEIGVGAGVVDRLHEQGYDVKGINVANPATDNESTSVGFINLRAEAYWQVRLEMPKMSLPKDDDFLQLANMKYKYNSKGQLQIESKDDMKKRGVSSPDVADMVMLTFADLTPEPAVYV